MKKIGLLIFILSLSSASIYAQKDRQDFMERIESKRIAFISDELSLSPEEAQVFWPVYNEYQKEMKALRGFVKESRDEIKDDIDSDAVLDAMIQREEQMVSLKKKYTSQMKDAIGSRKTLKFYHLERKFKEEMLKGLKKRRGQHGEDGK